MTNVSKSKKIAIIISSLVEIQSEKIIYCWRYIKYNHIKNNLNCLKKKIALYMKKFKPKAEMAKLEDKSKKNNYSILIIVSLTTMKIITSYYIHTNDLF